MSSMSHSSGVPEISVQCVAHKRLRGDVFLWVDAREPYERQEANMDAANIVEIPLSELMHHEFAALPPEFSNKQIEIIVFCTSGIRSERMVRWFLDHGWNYAANMTGGLAAWSKQIDPFVSTK